MNAARPRRLDGDTCRRRWNGTGVRGRVGGRRGGGGETHRPVGLTAASPPAERRWGKRRGGGGFGCGRKDAAAAAASACVCASVRVCAHARSSLASVVGLYAGRPNARLSAETTTARKGRGNKTKKRGCFFHPPQKKKTDYP